MITIFFVFWMVSRRETPSVRDQYKNNEEYTGVANLDYSRLAIACIAALSMTIGLGALVTHLPISLIAQGEASSASGPPFTTFALVATVIMASPLTLLADHRGRVFSLTAGLLLITSGLVFLGIFNGMFAAITGMAIFGAGFGLLFPTMVTVVTESTSSMTRGRAFGFFYAVYSLGVVIGSAASGTLADAYGETSGAPFALGAVATLLAIIVIALVLRFVPKALEREAI
jgi:MFS family permease